MRITIFLLGAFLFVSCDQVSSPKFNAVDEQVSSSTQASQNSKGMSWHTHETPATYLSSFYFVDSKTGWAVAGDGVILHTEDGGQSWMRRQTGVNQLSAVYFVNAKFGWVTSRRGTIAHTSDGGKTWHKQLEYNPPGRPYSLNDIHFADKKNGWAVGIDELGSGLLFRTKDGGKTWSNINTRFQSPSEVYFHDADQGWIVENTVRTGAVGNFIALSNNGGKDWTLNNETTRYLNSVHFADSSNGWVVGSKGTIFHSSDGGQSWSKQDSDTTASLTSVHSVDPQTVWAVGDDGLILHTRDGGQNWQVQKSGVSEDLEGLHFTDAKNGWAIGSKGTVLHYGEYKSAGIAIYKEVLRDPWIDASWNAEVDFESSEQVAGGEHAIRVTQDVSGALSVNRGKWNDSVDISAGKYEAVTFSVFASEEMKLTLRLENSDGAKFSLFTYGDIKPGSWITVSVPLNKLNSKERPWNRLDISVCSEEPKTYFIDDLGLTK